MHPFSLSLSFFEKGKNLESDEVESKRYELVIRG